MQKVISLILILVLCLSLCACGSENIKEESGNSFIPSPNDSSSTEAKPNTPSVETNDATQSVSTAGLRPEFKTAMDSYEAFYAEYCELLKQYKANPTDLSILTKYGQLMAKAEEMNKTFEAWDDGSLNNEELKYYLEVNNRVMQMMLDAAS